MVPRFIPMSFYGPMVAHKIIMKISGTNLIGLLISGFSIISFSLPQGPLNWQIWVNQHRNEECLSIYIHREIWDVISHPCLVLSWDNFVNALSQWETTLQSNVVSPWLGAYTKWPLLSGGKAAMEFRPLMSDYTPESCDVFTWYTMNFVGKRSPAEDKALEITLRRWINSPVG